jgi:hypothetical protein
MLKPARCASVAGDCATASTFEAPRPPCGKSTCCSAFCWASLRKSAPWRSIAACSEPAICRSTIADCSDAQAVPQSKILAAMTQRAARSMSRTDEWMYAGTLPGPTA